MYVNAGADGAVKEVIVSDWLKNSGGSSSVSDVSDLKDIKNVKGDETFQQNGEKLTWIQKMQIYITREQRQRSFL